MPHSHPRARRLAFAIAGSLAVAPLPAWAAGPVPAWAAGLLPTWVAYGLFIVTAITVIVLLVREALFDTDDDEQPPRTDAGLSNPQARYDAMVAASKTAANRPVS